MRVLLGSGGFRTPERAEVLRTEMQSFFGDVSRLLFIPYALADHDAYVKWISERGLNGGYEIDSIHGHRDPRRAVHDAEAIYVGGGNTFRLLNCLYTHGLIETIRERVRGGMPYFGTSAGCNVACPTMMTTNDMPIVMPRSFHALGLVPFQVNPHYYSGHVSVRTPSGDYTEHFGETRDERLAQFHELNETPIIGLWEAGLLRRVDDKLRLVHGEARLFRKGHPAVNVSAPTDLSEWL